MHRKAFRAHDEQDVPGRVGPDREPAVGAGVRSLLGPRRRARHDDRLRERSAARVANSPENFAVTSEDARIRRQQHRRDHAWARPLRRGELAETRRR